MKFEVLQEIYRNVHVMNLYLDEALEQGGDKRVESLEKAALLGKTVEKLISEHDA